MVPRLAGGMIPRDEALTLTAKLVGNISLAVYGVLYSVLSSASLKPVGQMVQRLASFGVVLIVFAPCSDVCVCVCVCGSRQRVGYCIRGAGRRKKS